MDAIPIAATRSRGSTTVFAVVVFLIAVVAAPTLVVLALVGAPGSVVIMASVSVLSTLTVSVAGYFISAGIRDARENPARAVRRELVSA